ncbi:hypothetical protein ACFSS9_14520 [Paenibacillus septentrionalis]|uniref:hypothetical protein n=1 Tax=Paenibacillus septentrionalis TaxID=429342 RepID=UPI00362C84F5
MQDGTIIAPSTHYADMQRKIVLLSDVDAEPVFIELPEDAPFRPAQMISSLGRYIIFQGDSSTAFFYSFNIDTLEWAVAAPYIRSTGNNKNYAGMIFYPDFVSSERRYMIDILQENLVRSDAEKYYIRIDDTVLSQLNNPKALAHLATEMLAQQMTYISLGTTSNEILHKRLLTTINNKGRFINNSNQRAAMTQAADLITNRKEAEVHVLMANETIPLSTIKSNLAVMQAELQAENILSTVNYIQGTSTSKLFELVNRIEWNDDRNNYVVMFNRGSMSELDSMDYEMELANELNQYYAHYISVGTTANAARNQSLIATMKGNGTTTTSTAINSIKNTIKNYISETAVKNPKRVTDTLVLNYNQKTGSYRSDVLINTFYSDIEGDPKINERFKTTHDPTVYENHTGLMEGIGQYQDAPTTQFTKVGKYEMVVQVQDNPSTNAAFANYRQWSLDSLSRLVLFVHRAPVAEFTAKVDSSRRLTISDLSYDLDRYSQRNKGIVTKVWKWKRFDDENWTEGTPPTTLAANTDYLLSLKVKDIEGAWSNEVIKMVSTKASNQPPVALFEINPKTVSWSKSFTITDRSYDPDGDALIAREWQVYRDGKQILTKSSIPTTNEMKQAAVRAGYDQLGQYHVRLRVQDSGGLWSDWYSDFATIVNHPPIAEFEPITVTYRDTINTVLNLTANPDQDGDAVSYRWRLLRDGNVYNVGTAKDASFRIRDRGLGKQALGTWALELRASDPLGAESYMTHSFQVVNQKPTAVITSSPPFAYADESYSFTSRVDDPDSEDRSSLKTFWRLTAPSGKVRMFYQGHLSNVTFDEKGTHRMELWSEDQFGAESDIVSVSFNVLNRRPVADFTRSPITTYRGIDIAFKSLATDYDGWIETYRYELMRDGSSRLRLVQKRTLNVRLARLAPTTFATQ